MKFGRWCVSGVVAGVLLCVLGAAGAAAQTLKDETLKGMKWRLIGPFRGGRVLAVTGVSNQPNIYYFGAVAGGVWKTTDGGLTWKPIFDKQPISSIGSDGCCSFRSKYYLCGNGRSLHPRRYFLRQWRLQIGRRGQDLDAHRPG